MNVFSSGTALYIQLGPNFLYLVAESRMAYVEGENVCLFQMALFSNFYWLLPSKRLLDNYTYQFIKAIKCTFGTTKFKQMVSYSHVLDYVSY